MSATFFSLKSNGHHRHLRSFPTRRSSDLPGPDRGCRGSGRGGHREAGADDGTELTQSPQLTAVELQAAGPAEQDRKSTRLNSSHMSISYAVFCLKKKNLQVSLITFLNVTL